MVGEVDYFLARLMEYWRMFVVSWTYLDSHFENILRH
jgi:hypothetical protein